MFLYLSILCLIFLFPGSRIIVDILALSDLLKLIEYDIIEHFNVGSLHTGGTGLDDACTLELPQRIDDDGACDADPVCDFARYEDALGAVQLIKDMDDRFHLREGQCADRRFHDLDLAVLLGILLIDRTHHLQTNDCRAILT